MLSSQCITAEFGDYLLTTKLSEGGMAELFLATRVGQHLQQQVALKRMLPHLSRQPEFVSMFLDEARVATRLSHPNLVQIIDFGAVAGEYYLAMEYLPGETLSAVLEATRARGAPLPFQVVLQLIGAACDGLHYAHEYADAGKPLGLVHRDISPSNVMVSYHGGVKVVDFGIAYSTARSQEKTQAGVVKGKLPYCSPEQVEGRPLDRRSDIFSLGALLYECLTGRRPFSGDSEFAICRAVLEQTPPPPSTLRPDLPPALDALVARTLAKRPDERFASCLELRRALEKFQAGPPVRLDEFLLGLFGEERRAARLAPQTSGTPVAQPGTAPVLVPTTLTPSVSAAPRTGAGAPAPRAADATPLSGKTVRTCPHADSCALFPQFKLVSLLSVWKVSYCDADYSKCVRFQMSKAGKVVSLAMLPNGTLLSPPRKR